MKRKQEKGAVYHSPLLQNQQTESKPDGNRIWQMSQVKEQKRDDIEVPDLNVGNQSLQC